MQVNTDKNYKQVLEQCFKTDQDLLDKFHIEAPTTLDKAVDRTYNDLKECNDLTFCTVTEDNNLVGYFGIEEKENKEFLTGFFINPGYRKRKEEFFQLVNNMFDGEYYTAVYTKNERAKKFLSKMSKPMEVEDITIFKFNNN